MSKAKTNADELDLTTDTDEEVTTVTETEVEETEENDSAITETVAENVAETVTNAATIQKVAETGETTAMGVSNKMGLSKFLRLHPQDIYNTALLQPYKSKAMTEQEWLDLLEELQNRKITC